MHRQRALKGRNMDAPAQTHLKSIPDRLHHYTDRSGDCWIWTGSTNVVSGYGVVATGGGKQDYAHRVSYEHHVGPIPQGYVIDHICRVVACVKPTHLRAVSPSTNVVVGLRGWGLTGMCRKGLHDVTDPANVEYWSTGVRLCKPCRIARQKAAKESSRG
jgi:hypothetical protein